MQRPASGPAFVLAVSIAVAGTALAAQYIGRLEPCVLCYYQRDPWYAVIALMVVALVMALAFPDQARARAGLLGLSAALLLAGAGLAFYHVGVEHKMFAGPSTCSSVTIDASSIDALRKQLTGKPIVRCDEAAWTMFGVSMAGYNFLASAVMAAIALWLAQVAWKGDDA